MDLASLASPAVLESALTEALRQRLTSMARVVRTLELAGGKGRRGTKLLRTTVERFSGQQPESVLELKVLRLLARARLPEPVAQFAVRSEGKVVARVDLAYPERLLAIEADGYRYHSSLADWKRDLGRRNALTALGWRIVHVTWDEVNNDAAAVVQRVRLALRGTPADASLLPPRR